MQSTEESQSTDDSLLERSVKVAVSIVVLTAFTTIIGYGGWLVLTLTSKLLGYDPETDDGDLLRDRLLAWPDRNREVMRTNGQAELPLKP